MIRLALLALAFAAVPGTALAAVDVRGSAEQVFVTGLKPGAKVILFGLCGHGNFDLAAYDAYLGGTLEDPEFSEADREAALARLPEAPAIA